MSMSFDSGANAGGLLQPGGVQLQQQQQQQQLQRLLYRMNAEGLQRGSSSLLSLSSLASLPSGSGLGRQPFYGRSFNFCDNLYEETSLCKEEEESGGIRHAEKKRRLNAAQVRSLERSFETESKLDPERKTQLAAELGLQPRQVAVWFQNRRARWKTKQLERDNLQLKQKYSAIFAENEKLRTQMARMNQLLREAGLREPEKEEEHDKERDQDEQEQDHEQPTITSSDCYCSEGTATFITPQNNNAEEEGDIEIARNNNNKAEDELEQSVSAASFCSDADSNLGHHLLCSNAMDAVQATKNEENQDHNKLDNLLYSDGVVCGDFPYDQWLFSYVRP